jgi:putative transcriptional regulator
MLKPKIKLRLVELDLTQKDMANELGVTKQTFNSWVSGRGNPTLEMALRLSKRLDCKVEDLFEYKEGE